VKVFTFGSIRNLYGILKPSDKDYIAKSIFTVNDQNKRASKLHTYLQLLVVARNLCAHDELFFNFVHGVINISITPYHSHFKLNKTQNGELIQGR
jgi:abortive infection bacteriophage resistance protein